MNALKYAESMQILTPQVSVNLDIRKMILHDKETYMYDIYLELNVPVLNNYDSLFLLFYHVFLFSFFFFFFLNFYFNISTFRDID